jgi:hypothetical protein
VPCHADVILKILKEKEEACEEMSEDEEDMDCAEQYEHGCDDCPDYDCPYRDYWWKDPMEDSEEMEEED